MLLLNDRVPGNSTRIECSHSEDKQDAGFG